MPDDVELLRQYAEFGSEEAFAELVRRRVDLVYSVALRRMGGDVQSAKDVVQVVFRDLANKASKLYRHPMLTGWLFTSTRYAAEHAKRAERRRLDRNLEAFERQTVAPVLSDPNTPENQMSPVVDQILENMGERDRLAILLRFYDNLPFAEIGRVIGTSEDGARMRVQRALERIRSKLEKQGIRSTTAALAAMMAGNAVISAPAGLAAQVAATSVVALGATLPAAIIPLMSTIKIVSTAALLVVFGAVGMIEWHEQSRLTDEYRQLRFEREKFAAQVSRAARDWNSQSNGLMAQKLGNIRNDAPSSSNAARAISQREKETRKRFAQFIRQQGLTPEQADRLIDLIDQQDEARSDLQEAIRKEGLSDGPAVETMRAELNDPIVNGLHQLLGDDGYSALNAYEKESYYESAWVQPLEGEFSVANIPINDTQAALLTQIVAANDHPVKIAASELGSESTIDWDSVVTQAVTVLTPDQLALLQIQALQLKSKQDQNIIRLKALRGTSAGNP